MYLPAYLKLQLTDGMHMEQCLFNAELQSLCPVCVHGYRARVCAGVCVCVLQDVSFPSHQQPLPQLEQSTVQGSLKVLLFFTPSRSYFSWFSFVAEQPLHALSIIE